MKKRVLSLVLCLTMLLTLFPAAFAEGESDPAEPAAAGADALDVPPEIGNDTVGTGVPDGPSETGDGATPADDGSEVPAAPAETGDDAVGTDIPDAPAETGDAVGADALGGPPETGDTDPSDVGADTPTVPTETDGDETPADDPANTPEESPVRVVFVCEPEETEITVYDPEVLDEAGEPVVIEPEEDESYLLLPGKYCYDAAAEGYAALEEVEFTVEAAEEDALPQEIRVTLEAAPDTDADPADVPAEEPDEEVDPAEEPDEEVDPAEADDGEENNEAEGEEDELIDYASGSVVASGSCGTSATYKLYSDGELVISGSGAIKMNSFTNDKVGTIQKLTIQSGITSIEQSAFSGCKNLRSISLPSTLTTIGAYAFKNCVALTSAAIPGKVTSISTEAFRGCTSLQSASFAGGATVVGDSMFYGCTALNSVTIGSSVKTIGYNAFYGCTSLQSISLPSSVQTIKYRAFYGCLSLQTITLQNGLTSIEYEAFNNCGRLTGVMLPATLTNLGYSAFQNCSALQSVTVPGKVVTPGSYLFRGCTGLQTAVIQNGVTQLSYEMFSGCTSLANVTIGNSVTSIESRAFYNCSSLQRISIPASVKTIGNRAFGEAANLQTVTLTNGLTTIEDGAFYNCKRLYSITLPSTLTSIGNQAFRYCEALPGITIPGSVTTVSSYAFANCTGLQSVTIANGATVIGSYMFSNCTALTNVSIGNSVGSIGDYAFNNCTALRSIVIPGSVKSIGGWAFSGATKLQSVTLANGLVTIGSRAFSGCGLTTISLPGSITSIGDYAFDQNTALKSITFEGDAPTTINSHSFNKVTATAYYNSNYNYWTDAKRQNYGGTLTWIDTGNSYIVSYDPNGGTGAPGPQVKTRGVGLRLSSALPSRSSVVSGSYTVSFNGKGGSVSTTTLSATRRQSFTFRNWNTAANGSGTSYSAGGTYSADASATLYAQWNTQYLVDAIQLPSATRSGYVLAGWSTSSTATMAQFQPGAWYTPNSNLTLYAVWQADPVAAFVKRAYNLMLSREPDAQGLSDWVNALRSGSVTGATLVNGFVNSPEFLNRGLSNESVVTILYNVMLNRTPDVNGQTLWAGYLNNGMSYTFIVNGFAGSDEFRSICASYGINPGFVTLTESRDLNPKVTAFVSRCYRLILQRVPDAGGLNAWTGALLSGTQTGAAVVNGFVLSPEFISRGLSNEKVVEILYAVMLDRVPDANGRATWVAFLNEGHTYTDIVNGFAGSAEFHNICADAGITAGWA